MNSAKAFTLIELLIVVAIIAILAAIAVPNFLEASTRSKVARSKADMRTCAVGIESYQVDHNFMPVADWENGTLEYLRWETPQGQQQGVGWMLTTPISYLSSIPWDVFNSHPKAGNQTPHYSSINARMASFLYRSTNKSRSIWIAYPKTEADAVKGYTAGLTTCNWSMATVGPDLAPWPQNHPGPQTYSGSGNIYTSLIYDPTNGTVSVGDIMYFAGWGLRGGGGQ